MVRGCSYWAGKDRITDVPVYVCSKCPEAIAIHACEPCLITYHLDTKST